MAPVALLRFWVWLPVRANFKLRLKKSLPCGFSRPGSQSRFLLIKNCRARHTLPPGSIALNSLPFIFSHSLCSAGCGRWLMLIYCERKVLLAGCGWWLMLICCERKVLLAGCGWCWFGVREKYCWPVAAEQSDCDQGYAWDIHALIIINLAKISNRLLGYLDKTTNNLKQWNKIN